MVFMLTPCASFPAMQERISEDIRLKAISLCAQRVASSISARTSPVTPSVRVVMKAGQEQPVLELPCDLRDCLPLPLDENYPVLLQ